MHYALDTLVSLYVAANWGTFLRRDDTLTCSTHEDLAAQPDACTLAGMHPHTQRLQQSTFIKRHVIGQPAAHGQHTRP